MDDSALYRSWIFVPGNRQRFIDKSWDLAADALILDIEDGVPPEQKQLARNQIAEALATKPGRQGTFVRVNAVGSPWFEDDLAAVLHPALDGILVPKVESADVVTATAERLLAYEREQGLPECSIKILIAIESALGLVRAPELAASHPRLLGLMLGAEDFALDLGLGTERAAEARELLYVRSAMVIAARSAQVLAVDGVFVDLDDETGLRADVRQARNLAFDGKATFHPNQIDLINEFFSPTADECDYADRVLAAFDEAVKRGDGAVAVGGQLVDQPIVVRAQRVLQRRDRLAAGQRVGG